MITNKFIVFCFIIFFVSCDQKNNRTVASALKESLFEMSKPEHKSGKDFTDETKKMLNNIHENANCYIDFDSLNVRQERAIKAKKEAILKLKNVKEIDTDINLIKNYNDLLNSEIEFFKEFTDLFELLRLGRDIPKIDPILKNISKKRSEVIELQDRFDKVQNEFDKKYEL